MANVGRLHEAFEDWIPPEERIAQATEAMRHVSGGEDVRREDAITMLRTIRKTQLIGATTNLTLQEASWYEVIATGFWNESRRTKVGTAEFLGVIDGILENGVPNDEQRAALGSLRTKLAALSAN